MAIFLIFMGSGVLIGALGVPLLKRMVPPNSAYGLRVAATLKDEAVWYEANARSGLYSIVAGLAIVVVAFLVFILGVPEAIATWINVGFLLMAVTAMCVKGSRVAGQLDREREHRGDAAEH